MIKLLNIMCGVLFAGLLCSCGGGKMAKKDFPLVATEKDGLVTIDLGKIKGNVELKLSEIIEPLEIVQLEGSSKEMMFERGQINYSENYVITGRVLKFFDRKSGKFIAQIGDRGRGPGEYQMIYDVQISEKDNRIFVLPWRAEKILTYDFKGNFVGDIPLAYLASKGKIHVDISANEIVVMTFPFKGDDSKLRPIWVQDTLGNVKHSIKSDPHFVNIPFDFSNEITSGVSGGNYIYSIINAANLPDTLYHYDAKTNNLLPKANIYIKELKPINGDYKNIIWNSICELPSIYICNVAGTVQTGDGNYQGEAGVTFMVYKDDLTGGGINIVNDYLAGEKLHAYALRGGSDSIMLLLSSRYFETTIENAKDEETKQRLLKLSENIDPEGNDIVVIGKYKK